MQNVPQRIVVGVSGASGTPLATRLLTVLQQVEGLEVHVVVSNGAYLTAQYEGEEAFKKALAKVAQVHDISDLAASISSGTFQTLGMVVVPCSMKTVAGIASGYTDNLLLRAADVTIKEQRPLVLIARESPLSPIHLRNMSYLAGLPGVSIMPPVLTYYGGQQTVEEMEHHIIAKALERFGIEVPEFRRWEPSE